MSEQVNEALELNPPNGQIPKDPEHLPLLVTPSLPKDPMGQDELRSFAYSMSHDMKSPSNTVRLILSEILETEGDRITVEGRELVLLGLETVDRMRSLIEDVLNLVHVTGDRRPVKPLCLNALINDCLADMKADITTSGALIDVGPLPRISGQSGPLRMLFSNLLGNAIKYVAPQTRPSISVRDISPPGSEMVQICVADNGIGIAPEYHRCIFGLFERLHLQEDYAGTGLGLAISQRVAEAHRGQIGLQSSPGEGSRFIVSLPRQPQ